MVLVLDGPSWLLWSLFFPHQLKLSPSGSIFFMKPCGAQNWWLHGSLQLTMVGRRRTKIQAPSSSIPENHWPDVRWSFGRTEMLKVFLFFFVVSGSWQRGTLPPQMLWKHIFLDFQDSWKFWKTLTWSLVPPGTNSWLANWATAVMAGRRSPQAEARMSLTVTLVALSVTMLWALLQRYSSSAGETTSSSSFLRTAVSFLLTRAQETPLWSLYCLVLLLPELGHQLCCCVLPVRVSISLLQHLDDLWQQMSRISGAQKIQQSFFAVLVIDDLIQRWQDLLKTRHDSLRFPALTALN